MQKYYPLDLILKYFPELSDVQKQQFEALYGLYDSWNSKINVISRKDIQSLYLKHVLHSLAIAKVVQFKPESSILDVGTGGVSQVYHWQFCFPIRRFIWLIVFTKKLRWFRLLKMS